MKFTESMLTNYSQPLSATEDGQCKNAIRMVADALKTLGFTDDNAAITPLYTDTFAYSLQMRRSSDSRNIKLFVQGSYANNTNVRTESDVDVAVIQEETFLPEYRKNSVYPQSGADYGFTPAPAAAKTFKDEVQEALKCKFGTDVERKNKSIKVHGNTYRKDADTVPCRRYRDYRQDYRRDASNFVGGVVIYPDNGGMIINYPEQHIANGRKKDSYITAYSSAAKNVSSFMLESLLWNIEDSWYLKYCGAYRKVFAFSQLIATLQNRKNDFWGYKEANGIKELCPKPSDYTNLCNFIDQLASFYEYE